MLVNFERLAVLQERAAAARLLRPFIARSMATAKATASFGGTMSHGGYLASTSGMPPTPVAITGVPQDSASTTTSPKGSSHSDGKTTASAALYTSGSRPWGTRPSCFTHPRERSEE